MRYVSIDIETSGLDHTKHSVLSIGAIVEDTELKLPFDKIPKFNAIVLQNEITGSPRALSMNKGIIEYMGVYLESTQEDRKTITEAEGTQVDGIKFYEKDEVVKHLFDFLFINGYRYDLITSAQTIRVVDGQTLPTIAGQTKPITINVAGKNFSTFDKLFLDELPWWKKLIRPRQRVIDPAILFCDWKTDKALPSLTECKQRAEIDGVVTHNALEDAWDVIQVLRKFY